MDLDSESEQGGQLDLAHEQQALGRRVGNNKLITAKGTGKDKGKGLSVKRSRSSTVDSDVSSPHAVHREPEPRADLTCAHHPACCDNHQTETQTQQGRSLLRTMQEAKGAVTSRRAGEADDETRRGGTPPSAS